MSQSKEQPLSEEELDWIQLRRELEDIRGKSDRKKTAFSRETWYLPAGLLVTTAFFFYGFYHMHHPTKSIIGAYARIFSQGITGIGCVYVFMTWNRGEKQQKKVKMEYTD